MIRSKVKKHTSFNITTVNAVRTRLARAREKARAACGEFVFSGIHRERLRWLRRRQRRCTACSINESHHTANTVSQRQSDRGARATHTTRVRPIQSKSLALSLALYIALTAVCAWLCVTIQQNRPRRFLTRIISSPRVVSHTHDSAVLQQQQQQRAGCSSSTTATSSQLQQLNNRRQCARVCVGCVSSSSSSSGVVVSYVVCSVCSFVYACLCVCVCVKLNFVRQPASQPAQEP